ncbi:hypothetical protein GCM10012319_18110 [Comamonas sp. KCTC 72670]|nr:hypothetical protein GCM10012319_18110 [Comamonas sp. KCTC 72670]
MAGVMARTPIAVAPVCSGRAGLLLALPQPVVTTAAIAAAIHMRRITVVLLLPITGHLSPGRHFRTGFYMESLRSRNYSL